LCNKFVLLFFWKILVQDGDYYRLLTDGDYHITASMDGYLSSTKLVTVKNKHHNEAQIINFELQPVSFKNHLFLFNTNFSNKLNIIFIFTPVSCFNWIFKCFIYNFWFQIMLPSNYNKKRKRSAYSNSITDDKLQMF